MPNAAIFALGAALSAGVGMGILATINGQAGKLIGSLATGLVVNILAGMIAGIVLFVIQGRLTFLNLQSVRIAAPLLIVSGGLGIATLTGIAFSVARIGTAAGLAAIIAGQMTTAVIIDTMGLGVSNPIPLNIERVIGLIFLGIATWLLFSGTGQS